MASVSVKESLLSLTLAALANALDNEKEKEKESDSRSRRESGNIRVEGTGEVRVLPDRARLRYRVSYVGRTSENARISVEKAVSAFAESVAKLNLDKDAFVADSISITPNFEYDKDNKFRQQNGYEAVREINLNIKDLSLVGEITGMAMEAGINQIEGFDYYLDERQKYEDEAAQRAIEDARRQAQALAQGFGVELGLPYDLEFTYRSCEPLSSREDHRGVLYSASVADNRKRHDESAYQFEPMVISATVKAHYSTYEKRKDVEPDPDVDPAADSSTATSTAPILEPQSAKSKKK